MPSELRVLGAGPSYTDRRGALGAAYLLIAGEVALLLDLGQGSFPALAGAWEPSRLTAVVVSHLHPDHFIDLVALRHYLRYEFEPGRRARVLAPDGLERRIDALHDQPGFTAEALDVTVLSPGEHRLGPFVVEAARVTHTADSYAFRVHVEQPELRNGALVYSGDCGRAEDLRALVRPGDTLLSEISFGAGPVPPGAAHLDGPAVGAIAAATGVGRLLLTHLQMGFDPGVALASVRARFDGEARFVWPGDRVVL